MTDNSHAPRQALGIGLEEFEYPYPVGFFPVANDLQSLTMGYMDVTPSSEANGSTVVLMHGNRHRSGGAPGGERRVQRVAVPPLSRAAWKNSPSPRWKRPARPSLTPSVLPWTARPMQHWVSPVSSTLPRVQLARKACPGCPIAPTALESPIISPRLRAAAARCFDQWEGLIEARLRADGWPQDSVAETASAALALIEGALLLARVTGRKSHLANAKLAAVSLLAPADRSNQSA